MLETIRDHCAQHGLRILSGFHPTPDTTLLMLGYGGPAMWESFKYSPEYQDGLSDPLDHWSERIITQIAKDAKAIPHFPFGDAPMPVLTWAQHSEPLWASPIGLNIHSERGLWSSWRGALEFDTHIPLPTTALTEKPCLTCTSQPCRTTCPVGAFTDAGYDTAICRAYLRSEAGQDCLTKGCKARRACPVGQDYIHSPTQAEFHMRAFLKG